MRRRWRWAVVLGLASAAALASGRARGHEFRPALLTITTAQDGAVAVSLVGAGSLGAQEIVVGLPSQCSIRAVEAGAGAEPRWTGRCGPPGLVGEITLEGLPTEIDVVVELRRAEAPVEALVMRGGATRVWAGDGARPGLWGYVGLGVRHILGGADHSVFVAGLVMMSLGSGVQWTRRAALGLLGTLTAFTAAHSLTLAAAALGWLRLRPGPVEACIALSIVALARALVRGGAEARVGWRFAFGCGLLHGLGFAGALATVGLPEGVIAGALLAFNVGVELGQVAAAAALVMALWGLWRAFGGEATRRVATAVGYGIGAVGMFWLFERLAALGSP